jgi:hypothetical protein
MSGSTKTIAVSQFLNSLQNAFEGSDPPADASSTVDFTSAEKCSHQVRTHNLRGDAASPKISARVQIISATIKTPADTKILAYAREFFIASSRRSVPTFLQ